MKIGDVAKKAQVNVQTLHFYERVGILRPKSRLESGYRIYDQSAVQIVRFIKHAQELGFSLKEIRDLITLKATTKSKCKPVQDKATRQLQEVKLKIAKLEVIRDTLEKLITDCRKQKTDSECSLLDCLDGKEFKLKTPG